MKKKKSRNEFIIDGSYPNPKGYYKQICLDCGKFSIEYYDIKFTEVVGEEFLT